MKTRKSKMSTVTATHSPASSECNTTALRALTLIEAIKYIFNHLERVPHNESPEYSRPHAISVLEEVAGHPITQFTPLSEGKRRQVDAALTSEFHNSSINDFLASLENMVVEKVSPFMCLSTVQFVYLANYYAFIVENRKRLEAGENYDNSDNDYHVWHAKPLKNGIDERSDDVLTQIIIAQARDIHDRLSKGVLPKWLINKVLRYFDVPESVRPDICSNLNSVAAQRELRALYGNSPHLMKRLLKDKSKVVVENVKFWLAVLEYPELAEFSSIYEDVDVYSVDSLPDRRSEAWNNERLDKLREFLGNYDPNNKKCTVSVDTVYRRVNLDGLVADGPLREQAISITDDRGVVKSYLVPRLPNVPKFVRYRCFLRKDAQPESTRYSPEFPDSRLSAQSTNEDQVGQKISKKRPRARNGGDENHASETNEDDDTLCASLCSEVEKSSDDVNHNSTPKRPRRSCDEKPNFSQRDESEFEKDDTKKGFVRICAIQ